ncbi:MAG: TIGR04219 family outer membrane beta-barrel protein [Ectothiorhodospiraceae bacterium]|nr:TIGR04219 family outer membrane beta-barrel protein [Ectothiorhodospiraceae bacterium]
MNRTRLTALMLAAMLPLSTAGAAGLTGINVGVGVWNQSPDGHVEKDGNRADLDDDLRLDSERQTFFWLDLRHPVPLLPRLKLQHTPMDFSGSGSVRSQFSFGDITLDTESDVRADVELDQTDIILYWTPWSMLADLDLGLNIKYVDGRVDVRDRDTGERERVSFSGPLPMLYARTEVRVPGTGVYGGADVSFIAYSGHRMLDLAVRAGYRADFGPTAFSIEGGWKRQDIRLDDFDDVDADVTVQGPYLGIGAHF